MGNLFMWYRSCRKFYLLGVVGIVLGIAVTKLEAVESSRGTLAAWLLIAFGLVYFVWRLRRALRSTPHTHWHLHGEEDSHVHKHTHNKDHMHVHLKEGVANFTPWILFTIFVFGPCEPLIPILMYPAAKNSFFGLVLVTSIFSVVTITTMMSIVLISTLGINLIPTARLERYTYALAGATICISGMAIQFLGL